MKDKTEKTITEIFVRADAMRKLLKLPEEEAEVQVSTYANMWNVRVSPSILDINGSTPIVMRRNYHSKSLGEALEKALKGVNEELSMLKEGKVWSLK